MAKAPTKPPVLVKPDEKDLDFGDITVPELAKPTEGKDTVVLASPTPEEKQDKPREKKPQREVTLQIPELLVAGKYQPSDNMPDRARTHPKPISGLTGPEYLRWLKSSFGMLPIPTPNPEKAEDPIWRRKHFDDLMEQLVSIHKAHMEQTRRQTGNSKILWN